MLFQKTLLKSATGREKSGESAGSIAWKSGSLPSDARPAECAVPSEFSDEAVETLPATVVLMIRTLEASSSMIPPAMSAAPLSTTRSSRKLTAAVSASRTNTPPPSSPLKLAVMRLRSTSTGPVPAPRPPPTGSSDSIASPPPESTASL